MKKMAILFLSLLLAFSFSACGKSEQTKEEASVSTDGKQETLYGIEESKILIAYFTRVGNTDFETDIDAIASASLNLRNGTLSGNTELIADMIHEEVGGDLFRIETENKYPVDYDALVDYAEREKAERARPKLISHVENMSNYEVVFIGFPNWWYDMPMAVYSFLEEYDFSGKIVIPFCTHGGSGFSGSEQTIKNMLSGAMVLDGLSVRDRNVAGAQDEVKDWLHEIGI